MQFSQLATVKHRLSVGKPLPFNVRNADHTLLLARGQVVDTCDQMEALFTRGALVDLAELRAAQDAINDAPPEQLPRLWGQCLDRVGQALQACTQEGFGQALDEVSAPVQALIERDSDLAIFQVLRQDGNKHTQYGITHSVYTAITAFLVAQRLGWDAASVQKVFKVALTMNLSMLELQGLLAEQSTPVTSEQREAILSHPQRSVQMLELAGITDRDWLDGVADHHVAADGSGYPAGRREVNDFAALARASKICIGESFQPRASIGNSGAETKAPPMGRSIGDACRAALAASGARAGHERGTSGPPVRAICAGGAVGRAAR